MLALQQSVTRYDPGDYAADGHARQNLDVVPFEPWHLAWLRLQPSQLALSSTLTFQHGHSLKAAGPCYSAFSGMSVVACAGVVEFWSGRAQVWSLLSEDWTRYTKSVYRAIQSFLDGYHVRRLECMIDPRSEAARRLAEHLGFEFEGYKYGYTPDGDTQIEMVRLQ